MLCFTSHCLIFAPQRIEEIYYPYKYTHKVKIRAIQRFSTLNPSRCCVPELLYSCGFIGFSNKLASNYLPSVDCHKSLNFYLSSLTNSATPYNTFGLWLRSGVCRSSLEPSEIFVPLVGRHFPDCDRKFNILFSCAEHYSIRICKICSFGNSRDALYWASWAWF